MNNVQLITGMGSAGMSHLQNCSVKISKKYCRYFTTEELKLKKKGGGKGVMVNVNQELKLL